MGSTSWARDLKRNLGPAAGCEAVLEFCEAWLDTRLRWEPGDPCGDVDGVLQSLAALGFDVLMRIKEEARAGDPRRLACLVPLCSCLRQRKLGFGSWEDLTEVALTIEAFLYSPEVSVALEAAARDRGTPPDLAQVFGQLRSYLECRIPAPFDPLDRYEWS